METKQAIFVGIDVSKSTLDVDLYPQPQPRLFANSDADRAAILSWLQEL